MDFAIVLEAKKLTSAATKIGLENGLGQKLEEKMREIHQQMPVRKREVREDGAVETRP